MNEGDVFNTEALKLSIRRINQLGYFKPMEGPPEIAPSAQGEDRLDVTFKVEEQNRNQFTFGGGVSGLEGTFINASFATSNFLGMGETLQVTAQTGARTQHVPVRGDRAVPVRPPDHRRDRPLLAQARLPRRGRPRLLQRGPHRRHRHLGAERRPLHAGLRHVHVRGHRHRRPRRTGPGRRNGEGQPVFSPFLDQGRHRESRFTPSLVHNTVDNPYSPRSGIRLSGSLPVAGGPLGGTASYVKPELEAVAYLPHTRRTALGVRGQAGWVTPFGASRQVPYHQRYFLGGEMQIRGVNVHSVGPISEDHRALGGNKFVLFNAEYYFDIAGPLRALLFYDAGQAFLEGQNLDLRQLRTSAGAEVRFIMPVLNVPFRLIYAFNLSRDAFQPPRAFKFAVGTTF